MKILKRLLTVLLTLALLSLLVWWDNNRLVTETFSFAAPSLPGAFEGFRVVQLTDLHGKQFGEGNERLIAAVRQAEPDLIALTGDFVDAYSDVSDIIPLTEALVELAPVYYVTGNHEWGSGQALTVMRSLRALGVTCLENQFVRVERGNDHILLAGVHDPNGYADQKTPEELAQEVYASEPNPFWLLLAHRNNLFSGKYCRLGASLTLCGHAHGGIWRLPFTDGLVDTTLTLLPSFTSGFYQCDDGCREPSWVFVSRGLGNSPRNIPRLFNPPQVAVIVLTQNR
ncbi:MAG: metallophosphoesterase [Oscillospiraceae bacterium]|nr:metallophosphoesterase [Oscillospiraceae bacterium]